MEIYWPDMNLSRLQVNNSQIVSIITYEKALNRPSAQGVVLNHLAYLSKNIWFNGLFQVFLEYADKENVRFTTRIV